MAEWSTLAKVVVLVFGMGIVGTKVIGVMVAPSGIVLNRLDPHRLRIAATLLYQATSFVATFLLGLILFDLQWWVSALCALAVALPTIATPPRHDS